MFSIEFSGHLSVPCVRPFSLFLSVVLRLKPRIYAVSFGFPVAAVSRCTRFFFRIFPDFFLSFLPKRIAEKEPKRYLPCSRCTMELSQPKGNNRKKGYKKREPWTGSKSPYKILYMLFIQNNFVCPLEAKLVCPLTTVLKDNRYYPFFLHLGQSFLS